MKDLRIAPKWEGNFKLRALKNGDFSVFKNRKKLGTISHRRDGWGVPEGYFWCGERLCANKETAALALVIKSQKDLK